MRHCLILIPVLLILTLIPSAQASQGCDGNILITIDVVPCFGDCPGYSAKIYTDGTVVYVGTFGVKEIGERRSRTSQKNIEALVRDFQRLDYWSLKDEYLTDQNGMATTDTGSTTTSICLNGKKKRVVNIYGPKRLLELEDRINNLAGLYQFLGPL